MSEIKKCTVVCPECGKKFETEMVISANVTLNPELKGKILDGSVFSHKCPECGRVSHSLHPILYHDMEKKKMIFLNSKEKILMTYADIKENEKKIKELMPEVSDVINTEKKIGVTTDYDLISEITITDHNLDRVAAYLLCEMTKIRVYAIAKENNEEISIDGCYLYENEEGKPAFVAVVKNPDGSMKGMEMTFVPELYKALLEDSERCKEMMEDDFLFGMEGAEKLFMIMAGDEVEKAKNTRLRICLVTDITGESLMAAIPSFNKKEYKKGDSVMLMNDFHTISGRVANIIDTTKFDFPFFTEDFPAVAWDIVKHIEPADENTAPDYALESLTKDALKLRDRVVWAVPGIVGGITSIDRITREGINYAVAYVKPEDIWTKGTPFKFDDLVSLVASYPFDYMGGLILKDGKNEIIFSQRELIEYKTDRIMLDSKAMKEFLCGLNDNEKEYMGISYDAIFKAYNEKTDPKKIAKDLGLNDKEIDHALSHGYRLLKYIILDSHLTDSVS